MPNENMPYQKYYSRYRKYYQRNIDPFVRSKHATAYSMIILSLFTIAFFGMFAIRPTLRTIIELKRQIKDNKEIDLALQTKINSLMVAQEEYQFIKDFVPAISEALPNQPNITNLLLSIENLALEKQATITSIQVQSVIYKPINKEINNENDSFVKPVITNFQPSPIDISLKVSANYQQLYEFLEKLLTMRRLVTAKSLEIMPNNIPEQGTVKILLRFNTYYLK